MTTIPIKSASIEKACVTYIPDARGVTSSITDATHIIEFCPEAGLVRVTSRKSGKARVLPFAKFNFVEEYPAAKPGKAATK